MILTEVQWYKYDFMFDIYKTHFSHKYDDYVTYLKVVHQPPVVMNSINHISIDWDNIYDYIRNIISRIKWDRVLDIRKSGETDLKAISVNEYIHAKSAYGIDLITDPDARFYAYKNIRFLYINKELLDGFDIIDYCRISEFDSVPHQMISIFIGSDFDFEQNEYYDISKLFYDLICKLLHFALEKKGIQFTKITTVLNEKVIILSKYFNESDIIFAVNYYTVLFKLLIYAAGSDNIKSFKDLDNLEICVFNIFDDEIMEDILHYARHEIIVNNDNEPFDDNIKDLYIKAYISMIKNEEDED